MTKPSGLKGFGPLAFKRVLSPSNSPDNMIGLPLRDRNDRQFRKSYPSMVLGVMTRCWARSVGADLRKNDSI